MRKKETVEKEQEIEKRHQVEKDRDKVIDEKNSNEEDFRNILKDTVYIDQFPIYETKYILSFKLDLF